MPGLSPRPTLKAEHCGPANCNHPLSPRPRFQDCTGVWVEDKRRSKLLASQQPHDKFTSLSCALPFPRRARLSRTSGTPCTRPWTARYAHSRHSMVQHSMAQCWAATRSIAQNCVAWRRLQAAGTWVISWLASSTHRTHLCAPNPNPTCSPAPTTTARAARAWVRRWVSPRCLPASSALQVRFYHTESLRC